MKKLSLSLFLASILCSPTFAGNQKKNLTVKAVTHQSQVREYKFTTPAKSSTNCSGQGTPTSGGQINIDMDCDTTSTPAQVYEIRRIDVVNVVEGDGNDYTISCTAKWRWSNCGTLTDGDLFEAEIDGATMWLHGRKGGNQGNAVAIKYKILDIRPAPLREGAVNALQSSQAVPRDPGDAPPIIRRLDTSIPDSGPPRLENQGQPGVSPVEGGGIGEVASPVGGGLSTPNLISKTDPQYTDDARASGCEGSLTVSVIVTSDGGTRDAKVIGNAIKCKKISDTRVVEALSLGLEERAKDAIKQWRFHPGMKNGTPVDVAATVELTFRP